MSGEEGERSFRDTTRKKREEFKNRFPQIFGAKTKITGKARPHTITNSNSPGVTSPETHPSSKQHNRDTRQLKENTMEGEDANIQCNTGGPTQLNRQEIMVDKIFPQNIKKTVGANIKINTDEVAAQTVRQRPEDPQLPMTIQESPTGILTSYYKAISRDVSNTAMCNENPTEPNKGAANGMPHHTHMTEIEANYYQMSSKMPAQEPVTETPQHNQNAEKTMGTTTTHNSPTDERRQDPHPDLELQPGLPTNPGRQLNEKDDIDTNQENKHRGGKRKDTIIIGSLSEKQITDLIEKNRRVQQTEEEAEDNQNGGKTVPTNTLTAKDFLKKKTTAKEQGTSMQAASKKEKKNEDKKKNKEEKEKQKKKDKITEDIAQKRITEFVKTTGQHKDNQKQSVYPGQSQKKKQSTTIHWQDEELTNSTPLKEPTRKTKLNLEQQKARTDSQINLSQQDKKLQEFERICSLLESEEEEEEIEEAEEEKEHNTDNAAPPKISSNQGEFSNDDLMTAMNNQFALMYNRMENNRISIEESLTKSLKIEIKNQLKVKSTDIKKSVARVMGNEIINLQTQQKSDTEEMERKLTAYAKLNEEMETKIKKMDDAMMFFNERYEDHENWRKKFDDVDIKRIRSFNAAIHRISMCEEKTQKNETDINDQERRWRRKNIRISNLNSINPKEPVKDTVANLIAEHNLLVDHVSHEEARNEIETAFRFGPKQTNRPKQILVRFFSQETRNTVMRQSKNINKMREIQPIYMQDDLSPADYSDKLEAKAYMKEAHKKGKKPRFYDGNVKINDETGRMVNIPKKSIQEYNIQQGSIPQDNPQNIPAELTRTQQRNPPTDEQWQALEFTRDYAARNHPDIIAEWRKNKHISVSTDNTDIDELPTNVPKKGTPSKHKSSKQRETVLPGGSSEASKSNNHRPPTTEDMRMTERSTHTDHIQTESDTEENEHSPTGTTEQPTNVEEYNLETEDRNPPINSNQTCLDHEPQLSEKDTDDKDKNYDSGTEVSSETDSDGDLNGRKSNVDHDEDTDPEEEAAQNNEATPTRTQSSHIEDQRKEHTQSSEVSEAYSDSRTSSYVRNLSTSQLENWIDQSIRVTKEKKEDREAYKAYMQEMKMEQERREREGKEIESYAETYIAELERRKIEEELNIGNQEYSEEEA